MIQNLVYCYINRSKGDENLCILPPPILPMWEKEGKDLCFKKKQQFSILQSKPKELQSIK